MGKWKILKNRIGQSLKDGLIQSFYLDGKLVDEINVVFLRFDTWISVVTTDETSILEVKKEPVESKSKGAEEDRFKYPLAKIQNTYPTFKKYVNETLQNYKELVFKGSDIVCGIKLYFSNNLTMILYSDTDENSYLLFKDAIPGSIEEL